MALDPRDFSLPGRFHGSIDRGRDRIFEVADCNLNLCPSRPREAAVEQILGRPIGADEEISIVAVPPQQVAASEGKAALVEKLEALLNRHAEKVRDIPEDEINSVVDEAVRHARHNQK